MAGRPTRVIEWDDFRIDLDGFRLDRAGIPVALEPKAFDVLALLVSEPGRLVTKQEIFDRVWPDTAVTDHALTRVIAQLRRSLGDQSRDARYIETVPTRGYRWIGPIRPATAGGRDAPDRRDDAVEAIPSGSVGPPVASGSAAKGALVWPAAAVGLAVVLGVGVWLLRGDAQPVSRAAAWSGTPGQVPWPVQVTTHAGLDLTPALSPRGDAVAFSSDRSGSLELYVRPFGDGGDDLPLTADGGQNVQPAWSPDGSQLAFHSARRGGVWVMPARGGVPRQVVAEGSNPAWSPDGQWLAYQTDEHVDITPSAFGAQAGATIALVRPDGRDGRPLTRAGAPLGGHASPTWSPNGRYIGFTAFDGGRDSGAWIVSVSEGRVTRLTESPKLYELAFAPDGRALYAAGGEALAYRIPFDQDRGVADGAIEPLVVAGVQAVRGVSVAADGRRLAFAGMALDSQIWAQPIGPGGQPRGEAYPLTHDTSRRQWMPTVSPDGRRVAYMSARRGDPPNVWVMSTDGSARRQLTDDRFADGKPTWYPDGRRVAYFSYRDGRNGLWAVDVETRLESPVVVMPARSTGLPIEGRVAEVELAPSLTKAALSLVSAPHGRRRVLVSGLDRFEPRAIGGGEAWLGYPVWSPDERSLAVELKEGSSTHLAIVDVASGALRRVTGDRGQTWVRSWSPDGRRVAAAVLRGGTWSLRWVDATSGEQGELMPAAPPNVYLRYPDWSRRGDLIVFERGELRGNIWTLPLPAP